jgi:hypothetical protein
MLLLGLMARKWGEFFISLGGVDGFGGVGAVVVLVFGWSVIRRRGSGIVPMLHGLIVRRGRVIICKGRRGKFGAVGP